MNYVSTGFQTVGASCQYCIIWAFSSAGDGGDGPCMWEFDLHAKSLAVTGRNGDSQFGSPQFT